MPLVPGQILAERYFIVRVVKSGGFGAVYEARDGRLDGAACAVKEMLEQHLGSADFDLIQRKFLEEKALLARLKHPGIPAVRDFFRQDQLCYIVMDYIHGANLQQELVDYQHLTGQPFPPEVLVSDILQILDVLDYLHGLDPPVVHRDIKPANVIREFKTGKIMLVDFGLARHVSGLQTQTAMGTLGYCPLEQMQGKSEPRSDLYALGVTMNHLLSGKAPIPLGNPSLLTNDPTQDPILARVVDQACALQPEQRFASAREMREALRQWQTPQKAPASTVLTAPAVDWPVTAPDAPGRWPSTTAMATGTAVALGLALALFVGWPAPTPTPTPTPELVAQAPEIPPTARTPEQPHTPLPPPARPVTPKPAPSPRTPHPRPAPPRPVALRPSPVDTPGYPTAYPTARYTPRQMETPLPRVDDPDPPPSPSSTPAPLSGSLQEISFPRYALQLSIPAEFKETHRQVTRGEVEAQYVQEEPGVFVRKIDVTAKRNQISSEFKRERLTKWHDLFGFRPDRPMPDAEYFQMNHQGSFAVVGLFVGKEPHASAPVQYEVMISVGGPGASLEVEPLANQVLGSVRWKGEAR